MNHNEDGDETSGQEEDSDTSHHEIVLSLDTILSLLANHQRREVLQYLIEAPDGSCSLDECVDHLVKQREKRNGNGDEHDQVKTPLCHIHIPKLEDAGVVEYDPRSRQLRYWGEERLESWLARIHAEDTI